MRRAGLGIVARLEREVAEVVERAVRAGTVSEGATDLERLAVAALCQGNVDDCIGDRAGAHARSGAECRWLRDGELERPLEPSTSLREVTAHIPEPTGRCDEPQRELAIAVLDNESERGAEIILAPCDLGERTRLVGAGQELVLALDFGEDPEGVAPPDLVRVVASREALVDDVAHGGEQREPAALARPPGDQALVHERRECGDVAGKDASTSLTSNGPANTARSANACRSRSSSRSWLHSIAARRVRWRSGASRGPPVRGRAGGRGAPGSPPGTAGACGRRPARSRGAGRRAAGRSRPRPRLVRGDTLSERRSTLREEDRRRFVAEGLERVLVLLVEVQALSARREDRQPRAIGEEVGDRRSCTEHLLEIVEDEQQAPISDCVSRVTASER